VHFGRAPAFIFVDIEDGKVLNKTVIENPGAIQHTPGSVPKFLHDNKANVIVSGGMGDRAIQFFEQYGIRVILGASGNIDATIKMIAKGEIKDGINIAHPNGQQHNCGDPDHKHDHNCGKN
jgi:predicted Fe-Mo cluster-binding NifX family protein